MSPANLTARRVPVTGRVLFADRRRGVLTVAGVAAALLLVLTLDALFTGAVGRVTAYSSATNPATGRGGPARLIAGRPPAR